ncbi:MAG: hypothetical protein QOJ60_179, partial [Actinomycetota bacterium]|nr:hypothetical protein [Actinomycetota bacterium]
MAMLEKAAAQVGGTIDDRFGPA